MVLVEGPGMESLGCGCAVDSQRRDRIISPPITGSREE